MNHYKQAENLVDAGLMQPAMVHAILAVVDVLRAEPSGDCDCGDCKDYELPEFLRPIKDLDVKRGVL